MPPRTIVVSPEGAPAPSLSFVLPPAVDLTLESVLAEIDASGAGDTSATLTIADSSGAVIARMRQGETVAGGAPGSATWALRLADSSEAGGAGGSTRYAQFADHTGVIVPVGSATPLALILEAGTLNVGLAGQVMTFLEAGTYSVHAWLNMGGALGDYVAGMRVRIFTSDPTLSAVVTGPQVSPFGFSGGGPAWSVSRPFAVGDRIDFFGSAGPNGGGRLSLYGIVARLA